MKRSVGPQKVLRGWLCVIFVFALTPTHVTANEDVFQYQIMNGAADPFVTYHDGYYYMTFTQVDRIDIYKSASLADIANGEVTRAFTPPADGWGSQNIWAPKLHHIDGKWYLYYTADDGVDANHRMYVLENTSSDPMSDSWVNKGQIENMPDIFAIDGNTFENDGTRYFVWSTRTDGIMELWMDEMINPWTVRGDPVIISSPTYDWEKVDGAVNEGPAILKRNGRIFMTYSATGCQSEDYAIGLLTAWDTSDLMDPASWEKSPEPVFSKNPENDVYGPGHNSFTTSPDGKEDWMVYHANSRPDAGCSGERGARVQKIEWNEDGTPDFGTPAKVQILVDCIPGRYEAQDAIVHNAKVISYSRNVSCGKHVGYIDFEDSYVEFPHVYAPYPGVYKMTINYAHGMAHASHQVTVNQGETFEVQYPQTGWGNFTDMDVDVQLRRGLNTIRIAKGENFSELNYIAIQEKHPPEGPLKGPLQAKIDQVESLQEEVYTPESWATLQSVLEETEVILADPDASQQQLDTAFGALTLAVDQLQLDREPSEDGAPKVASMEIAEDAPDRLTLTFNQAIDLDYANGFFLLGTEGPIMVTSVNYKLSSENHRLTLNLAREARANERLSLSYDDTVGSVKADDSDKPLSGFIGKKVHHPYAPKVSPESIRKGIHRLGKEGLIYDRKATHSLKRHMTAVDHFAQQKDSEKVIKHLKGFLFLLDHQKDNDLISKVAHIVLKFDAETLMEQWK